MIQKFALLYFYFPDILYCSGDIYIYIYYACISMYLFA